MGMFLIFTFILTLLFFLVVRMKWTRHQRERRIKKYKSRESRRIDQSKILIAIQPIDIFVEVSTTRKDRFIQLEIQRSGLDKALHCLKRLFGAGAIYYRIKDKKINNVAFIESLLQTNKVELFLYTALDEEVADLLLKKLDLAKYFKEDCRRYCDGTSEELKHPTEVDSTIKRVMIITGSKLDHSEEDSEYFLVLKRKEKKLYGKALADMIARSESIDELHQQFVHWKVDIESDYEQVHEKQD